MDLPDWTEGFKFHGPGFQRTGSEESEVDAPQDAVCRSRSSQHNEEIVSNEVEYISQRFDNLSTDSERVQRSSRGSVWKTDMNRGSAERQEQAGNSNLGGGTGEKDAFLKKQHVELATAGDAQHKGGQCLWRSTSSDTKNAMAHQCRRKSLTPSRIGLTGQALRVETGKTPISGAEDSRLKGQHPPATNFHGILKKLEFSTAGKASESSGQTSTDINRLGGQSNDTAKGFTNISCPTTVGSAPQTTTKRLEFDSHRKWTPLPESSGQGTNYVHTFSKPVSRRRVAFRRSDENENIDSDAMIEKKVLANVESFNPPIYDVKSSPDGSGTVNSRNAGSTPFNRRLSQLLSRYSDGPILEADVEELETICNIENLPTSGVEESSKYSSSVDTEENFTFPASFIIEQTPASTRKTAQAISQMTTASDFSQNNLSDYSHKVNGMSYRSCSVPLVEGYPNIEKLAVSLSKLLESALQDIGMQNKGTPCPATKRTSITSARPPKDASSPIVSTGKLWTPTSKSSDGIPRDAENVPLLTPSSVTIFRGSSTSLPSIGEDSFGRAINSLREWDMPSKQKNANDTSSDSTSRGNTIDEFSFDTATQRNNVLQNVGRPSFQGFYSTVKNQEMHGRKSKSSEENQKDQLSPSIFSRKLSLTPSRLSTFDLGPPQRVSSVQKNSSPAEEQCIDKSYTSRLSDTTRGSRELRALMRDLSLVSPSADAVDNSPGAGEIESQRKKAVDKEISPTHLSDHTGSNVNVSTPVHRYGTRSATKTLSMQKTEAKLEIGGDTCKHPSTEKKCSRSRKMKMSPTEASIRANLRRKSSRHSESAFPNSN